MLPSCGGGPSVLGGVCRGGNLCTGCPAGVAGVPAPVASMPGRVLEHRRGGGAGQEEQVRGRCRGWRARSMHRPGRVPSGNDDTIPAVWPPSVGPGGIWAATPIAADARPMVCSVVWVCSTRCLFLQVFTPSAPPMEQVVPRRASRLQGKQVCVGALGAPSGAPDHTGLCSGACTRCCLITRTLFRHIVYGHTEEQYSARTATQII